MLEIDGSPQALAQVRCETTPAPGAQRLVPGLEMVNPRRQEHRQGAGDDHVVECTARVVDDPVPLLVVDHLPASV